MSATPSALSNKTGIRKEADTFGPLDVPADRYWGAQTQRSVSKKCKELFGIENECDFAAWKRRSVEEESLNELQPARIFYLFLCSITTSAASLDCYD